MSTSEKRPLLARTPLFERHRDAGAKMMEFAGFEMPVEYDGVTGEHLAVRDACGIFDVSHMGEIETSGAGALALLQRVLSNDASAIAFGVEAGAAFAGGAQYSVICREDGGVLDDVFTYRLDEHRYLTSPMPPTTLATSSGSARMRTGSPTRSSATASPTTRCSPYRVRWRAGSCRRCRIRRFPCA